MNFSQLKKTVVIVLFLCAVCFSLLTPIRDNDFFWHLATGKWIAEHRELPKTDPFAYTTAPKVQKDSYRAKIILSQYWLANLLQYGAFSLAGFYGIIALRALIIILTLLVLVVHMRKKGLNAISAVLLVIPVCFVLVMYKGDRPNQMTFLFAALFMFLADSLKRGEKKGYFLPLVLLIWANMHGGFLLGSAIVIIMGIAELIRKMFLRDYSLNRKFLIVLLITLLAGFVSPNGYTALYSMFFEMSVNYNTTVSEFMSPWTYARIGYFLHLWILGISLLFAGWYFASRFFSRSSSHKETLLAICDELMTVVFLAAISFTAIRYIPLLVIVLAPLVVPLFSGKFQGALLKLSGYHVPELMIVAFSLWGIYGAYDSTVLKLSPVDPYFPDDAVQFIREKDIKGRFFNAYDWGGYLIWQFYPEQCVFTDGRGLSMDIYSAYLAVMFGEQGKLPGEPRYKAVLDSYSIRHIIIPANDMFGLMHPILTPLVNDPEWRLIFVGRNSLIFSRDQIGPAYSKTLCYNLALANALELISTNPEMPFAYLTVARANFYLGRPMSAMKGLEDALQKRPALRGGPVERELKALRESRLIPAGVR